MALQHPPNPTSVIHASYGRSRFLIDHYRLGVGLIVGRDRFDESLAEKSSRMVRDMKASAWLSVSAHTHDLFSGCLSCLVPYHRYLPSVCPLSSALAQVLQAERIGHPSRTPAAWRSPNFGKSFRGQPRNPRGPRGDGCTPYIPRKLRRVEHSTTAHKLGDDVFSAAMPTRTSSFESINCSDPTDFVPL